MGLGFTRHARRKMRQLRLSVDAVGRIVADDDVIERYERREGMLVYGRVGALEIHVSVVRRDTLGIRLVTTVYEVDRAVFPDGRTRRSNR